MSHFTLKEMHYVKDGTIVTPKGFLVDGIHAGFRRKKKDIGLLLCKKPATAAAVYTTNKVQAAPIQIMKKHVEKTPTLQAIIVNSGNANACTGERGLIHAEETCRLVAEKYQIPLEEVGVASTGIIGEQLPMDLFPHAIQQLTPGDHEKNAHAFSQAILTTDTCTKTTCYEGIIHGEKVTVAGVAKGSGMIDPNMATMLSFITTDAKLSAASLQKVLSQTVEDSFNCITVDGDMSTNDMVCMLASGEAHENVLEETDSDWTLFKQMVQAVCTDLAKMIARDGEGATKLIEVHVQGAETKKDAKKIGLSIVGSSLVKTAVYGSDPNWGRIIAAIGYSGVPVEPGKIDILIDSIYLFKQGKPCSYEEEDVVKIMNQNHVTITVHVHMKTSAAIVWGCDLTYDYVHINASYRS
ncbi:MAG TPA: bifunctional glutamate N-acetyltransferase/amino-acid acetyltransferase ArgJ [Bacillota bacterium]|nr:bifunctional glutamate N-acetyltransferase/amino-acid acetyltransferase ArgJ [Bacillota bacterium]